VPAVSNASPLIALAAIERLNLLPALFTSVLIPPAVAQEIKRSIPVAPVWLTMKALGTALPTVVMRRTLADGEREAIALAIELHADPIILDDLPARRVAKAVGLNVIGAVGVLLGAKRVGLTQLPRFSDDDAVFSTG
jgi:predicted nucleic acid-binding protein